MNAASRRYADAEVLPVNGRLDQDSCEAFKGVLLRIVEDAARDGGAVILDLTGLEYVSSAGLRCFVLAARQAKSQQGRVFVASLQPMVKEIFEISHFNLIFQVFPTVREALAAVSSDALASFEEG
jgi:anti-anti-sigma factor